MAYCEGVKPVESSIIAQDISMATNVAGINRLDVNNSINVEVQNELVVGSLFCD